MPADLAFTADAITAIEADMEHAFARHGAGDNAGAADACRRVLAVMPGHVTAAHLLGVIVMAAGDFAEAADLLARAAAGNPADAAVQFNHAVALGALARLDEAV